MRNRHTNHPPPSDGYIHRSSGGGEKGEDMDKGNSQHHYDHRKPQSATNYSRALKYNDVSHSHGKNNDNRYSKKDVSKGRSGSRDNYIMVCIVVHLVDKRI